MIFVNCYEQSHSFEVDDLATFLGTLVDTTVPPNNELTANQNQIDWNHKIKQIPGLEHSHQSSVQ